MPPKRPSSAALTAEIMPTAPAQDGPDSSPRAALLPISKLIPDRKNARRRTPRSRDMLARSMEEFGAARSIVVDENGRVVAGNGTAEAAINAGIDRVLFIPSDGNTLIAVQRFDLSETEKISLALADNRTGDTSEFDGAMLAQLVEEDAQLDVSPWFSEEEFAALVAGDQVDEDETEPPAPPSKPDSGLEIKLQFATQEEFNRFGTLLVQLAAALPEPAELTGRLALVIEAYLDRSERQRRQPRA
jgi:hypothetical protein